MDYANIFIQFMFYGMGFCGFSCILGYGAYKALHILKII